MGVDYYAVLEINRGASQSDIRKAYARIAIRERPERTKDCNGQELSAERIEKRKEWFKLAGEAYEVLSRPFLRAAYDQFGEEGLKNGVPARDPELYLQPWTYHGDIMKTYKDFFGTESISAPLILAWQNYHKNHRLKRPDGMNGPWFREKPREIPLQIPLEKIFTGGQVEVRFDRREIYDDVFVTREHAMRFDIPPGVQPGSRYTFPKQGNHAIKAVPGDIVVVVEDSPHATLKREGLSDLVAYFSVSLEEALLGCSVVINTLDNRVLRVRITDIITPTYECRVRGEGLPECATLKLQEDHPERECYVVEMTAQDRPCESCAYVSPETQKSAVSSVADENCSEEINEEYTGRGDLVLRFKICWPQVVPTAHRETLRSALKCLTSGVPQDRSYVSPLKNHT